MKCYACQAPAVFVLVEKNNAFRKWEICRRCWDTIVPENKAFYYVYGPYHTEMEITQPNACLCQRDTLMVTGCRCDGGRNELAKERSGKPKREYLW